MEQNINHTDGTNTNLRQRAAASGLTKMEQSRTFMGDDKLTIDAIAAQPLDFRVGDTINVHGNKYTINRLPTARKEGERRYSYSVTLEGAQYGLITAQFLLFDNITDDVVANPSQYTLDGLMLNSLSGTAGDILKMIVLNANRVHGDGAWIVGTIPASTDTLNFTLEDGTCLEALQALAEQWELEWEISTDANGKHTINLAKEPTTIPSPLTTFAYGRTGGLYSIERAAKQDDIITRLYAYGSTQNIPTSYLQEANTSRLCIKNGNNRKKHLSYVENATLKQQYGLRESVEVFDEIYPQRVGTVTAIYSSGASFWKKFRDSDMFDLNARDSQTGETLYLIPGTTAKVTFQTGQLAGYTFNITDWNNTTKCFTIEEFKEEGDLTLPSETVSNLRIKTGDKYILTDINLPTSYITAAETKLKQYAEKKLAQLNADLYQYTVELDSRYVKKHATGWGRTADNPFKPGDFIAITDSELNTTITLRLTAYTHDLINDTYTLTVELYQPRIKTTQTRRRRWYIDDWRNRIAERISINNEYTAERAAEVAATGMEEIIAGRGTYSSIAGRMEAINTSAGNAMGRANNAYELAEGMTPLTTFNTFKGNSGDFGILLAEVIAARNGKSSLALRFGDFLLETSFDAFKGNNGAFGILKAEFETARGGETSLSDRLAKLLLASVFNTFKTDEFTPTKNKADTAYQKPNGGIPASDLIAAVQTSLGKADTAYQLPSGGIPKSDLVAAVQTALGKADTAYQLPSGGIPTADLAQAIRTSLGKADTALQEHQSLAGLLGINDVTLANGIITIKGVSITPITQHQDISGKANISDVYTKAQTYTKTEVNTALLGKAASSLFAGVYFTLNSDTVKQQTVTLDKDDVESAGVYPRIVMIDSQGNETQPQSISRAGATDTITLTLTQTQMENISKDETYTVILIQ